MRDYGWLAIERVVMLKMAFVAVSAVASVAMLTAAEHSISVTAADTVQSVPCAPILTAPTYTDTEAPIPPTNLRIIKGSEEATFSEMKFESGPFENTDAYSVEAPVVGTHPYFADLVARPDCHVSYTLRSREELDGIKTTATDPGKGPVSYDSVMDAALFKINPNAPAGSGLGSTDSQQKRPIVAVNNTSMLVTWDLRFDSGFAYLGTGYLDQHKTFRMNGPKSQMWLTAKTSYRVGARDGLGVAEIYFTNQNGQWNAPGTTMGGAETVMPRVARFGIQPNTWTRVWIFVDGVIGGGVGGTVTHLSIWAADENRDPIQLYDRVAYYTPIGGIEDFWFEYDTSQDVATNGEMRSWNRNLVVLKGIGMTDVVKLLQRPAH